MNYDKRDKLILEKLYHSWRITSSQLSKETSLSRRQVDYRIKQYFSNQIIRAIFTVFDYSKLGYLKPAYLFISLKNKKELSLMGKYMEETRRCTSWGRAWTEYDLLVNLVFKNKKEFSFFLSNFKKKFKDSIEKLIIIDPNYAEFYPLKTIGSSLNESYLLKSNHPSKKKRKLDKIDIEIIKEIASNARKPLVDIAQKVKISPERALYRIKNLVNNKIILGSRIQFNIEKAGYLATCLFIETELDSEVLRKIKDLCKTELSVNYLIVAERYPQIIIQTFHRDANTLRQIEKKIASIIEKANKKAKISLVELEDDMDIVNPIPFW